MKNSEAQDRLLKESKERLDEADCYIVATKKTDHFKELEFPKMHLFIEGRKGLVSLCISIMSMVYDIFYDEDGYISANHEMNVIINGIEDHMRMKDEQVQQISKPQD